jgi:hypothetical protein
MEKVKLDQLMSLQFPSSIDDENKTSVLLEDEALSIQQPPVSKKSFQKHFSVL